MQKRPPVPSKSNQTKANDISLQVDKKNMLFKKRPSLAKGEEKLVFVEENECRGSPEL